MKLKVLAALLLLSSGTLYAAQGDSLRIKLIEPTIEGGSIAINEVGDAETIMNSIESQPRAGYVRGYRVGIFFDNGQDARLKAVEVKRQFEELYPDIKVHISYENPYFKVAAGDCIMQEEAVILLEKIRPNFPKAFIQRDNIAVDEL